MKHSHIPTNYKILQENVKLQISFSPLKYRVDPPQSRFLLAQGPIRLAH